MPTFADNLKRLRDESGLTQVGLAHRSGLTQSAISRYETGEDIPELLSVLKLAAGLRVPLEPLVEGLDVKFDAVYRDLRLSITTIEDETEIGAEAAPAREVPFDEIMPGAPAPAVATDESRKDVAAARAKLQRIASELLSVSADLAPELVPVARTMGSEVRPGDARRRARTRPRNAPKSATKRR